MTWRVTITREDVQTDGQGPYQRSWSSRVLAFPVSSFDEECDARTYAARVLAASTDPTLEVSVSGPPERSGMPHLDERARTTGLAGIRAARKHLGGEP